VTRCLKTRSHRPQGYKIQRPGRRNSMSLATRNNGVAVVLLHNVDPSWEPDEITIVMNGAKQLIKEL
jgi:hypothetical protein